MGRSKRNWDQLVTRTGEYGINIREGVYPGSDGNPIKGNKGKKGEQGEKGKEGQKGNNGQRGPVGVGRAGDKGQKGLKGDKGTRLLFADLSLSERELIRGLKGDPAASQLLSFAGSVETAGELPAGTTVGEAYFITSEQIARAWDGTEWADVGPVAKGERGIKGQSIQGEKGDEGSKGEPGVNGLLGAIGPKGDGGQTAFELAVDEGFSGDVLEWLESLKGQKGDAADALLGDEFNSDEYYTSGQVDGLIDGFKTPEAAFHFGRSGTTITTQVNFRATDRNLELYDEGCLLLTGGVIRNGSEPPLDSTPTILIVNLPVHDPMGSRSHEYKVLQFAYSTSGHGTSMGYCRLAQPSRNIFTAWQPTSIDEALYYNKQEVNNQLAVLRREMAEGTSSFGLTSEFTWENLVRFAKNRTLKSLADIEAGNAVSTETRLYSTQLTELPVTPMTKGSYFVDDFNNTIILSQNDQASSTARTLFDETEVGSEHRLVSVEYDLTGKVTAKDFDGKNFSFTYEDPLTAQTVTLIDLPFSVSLLTSFDTADGAVLRYNSAADKWVASELETALTKEEADGLYSPIDEGPLEATDASLLGTTTAETVVAETLQLSTEATEANEAVTLGMVDSKLSRYLTVSDASRYVRKESVLLESHVALSTDDSISYFTASGHPSKKLQFRVETENGNFPVLTLGEALINCNGLRLTNVANPQLPTDAVNLDTVDRNYASKDRVEALEAAVGELERKLNILLRG